MGFLDALWIGIVRLEHAAERAVGLHPPPDPSDDGDVLPGLTQPVPASIASAAGTASGTGGSSASNGTNGDDPIVGPAFSYLAAWTPEDRSAAREAQLALGLDPKQGGLLTVILAESGGKASAQNPRAPKPAKAAGLFQLTRGARLPGFDTDEAIQAVTSWSPARQFREVGVPLFRRNFPNGASAAQQSAQALRRLNFLPALASKDVGYVLGVREGSEGPNGEQSTDVLPGDITRGQVYASNYGFDAGARPLKDGQFTGGQGWFAWHEVDQNTAALAAQGARRGWITVSGHTIPASADPPLAGDPHPDVWSTPDPGLPIDLPIGETEYDLNAFGDLFSAPDTRVAGAPSDSAGGQLPAAIASGTAGPIQWVDVPGPEGMTLSVASDMMTAPIGGAQLRAPVSWLDTIAAARAIYDGQGAEVIAPTKRLADAIYQGAAVKTVLHGLVQKPGDDAKMGTVGFAQKYNADVDGQIAAAGHAPGDGALVSGAEKCWLLDRRLDKAVNDAACAAARVPPPPGNPAVNYGGWGSTGKPVQSVGGRHNDGHYDYSQLFRPVKRWATAADGSPVDLLAWVQSAEGVPARFAEMFDFKGGGVGA